MAEAAERGRPQLKTGSGKLSIVFRRPSGLVKGDVTAVMPSDAFIWLHHDALRAALEREVDPVGLPPSRGNGSAAMPDIHHYIEDTAVFEPEAIRVMAQAYDEACRQLNVPADAKGDRLTIATRIIDLARSGVIDAAALRDRVMLEARSKL